MQMKLLSKDSEDILVHVVWNIYRHLNRIINSLLQVQIHG